MNRIGGNSMKFTINGFISSQETAQPASPLPKATTAASAPRKSVVQVRFPGWDEGLAYYNNQFDLKPGDRVYVDGKLEGQLGIVTAVNYTFKIKLSEYKRVTALVNTDVHGKFYMAGSHFVSFDPNVLPPAQVTLSKKRCMSAAMMILHFRWTFYRKWASAAQLRSVGTNTTWKTVYNISA